MKRFESRVLIIIGMAVCIFVSSASANLLIATSTAEEVEAGVWKYTIEMQYDFSDDGFQNGLSHWDLAVCDDKPLKDAGELTNNIWFNDVEYPYLSGIDGTSTPDGEGGTDDVLWFGTTDNPFNGVKYEQPVLYDPAHLDPAVLTEPGPIGEGTFSFYSIWGPETVTDFSILSAKADTADFEGTLSGDWVCIPEPATLMLLTLGSLMVARKRR